LDWGYPYDYGYYYPNAGDYYYSYSPTNYYAPTGYGDYYAPTDYGDTGVVAEPAMAAPQQPQTSTAMARAISEDGGLRTDPVEDQHGATDALQYYSEARAAFLDGDYRSALRLAGHAAVDEPRNPKVHELISLALFALRNYTAAASEAHAAMAMGTTADWKDLVGYYFDAEKHTTQFGALEVEKYTTQLRALEKASAGNPKSAAEHFLLGYHYLMIDARDNAKTQFAEALKLAPSDKLAGRYRQELLSNPPHTPPQVTPTPLGTAL
jgi:tetratricopeptide (TPR) repeat protein